jgi:hypothetical protein
MHDIELLVLWFSSIITAMILTILLPRMVSESRGSEAAPNVYQRIPAHQGVYKREGSMILIGKEV